MSDDQDKGLGQLAMDLLVYAPAGFVSQVLEDFPSLASRGRERIGSQVTNARVIGQFVVTIGQKQIKERLAARNTPAADRVADAHAARARAAADPVPSRRSAPPRPAASPGPRTGAGAAKTAPAPTAGGGSTDTGALDDSGPPTTPPGSWRVEPLVPPRASRRAAFFEAAGDQAPEGNGSSRSVTATSGPRPATGRNGELRDTVDAAIPGYDTLSASQVVRRLDGLGRRELEAVSRHESSNRRRRTILFRAQQLLGDEAGPGAGGTPDEPGPADDTAPPAS